VWALRGAEARLARAVVPALLIKQHA